MSAMAYHMMARFMKFMLKTVLWMTRMFERCLETLDGKDLFNFEKPMMEREDREQVNQANEPRDEADTVDWEEIPAPDPQPANNQPANNQPINHQPTTQNTERRPVNVSIICPLCTNLMRIKPAHRGGWFYGCSDYPDCNGYRNYSDKKPGPVKQVANLRQTFGPKKWAMIEEQKLNGKFLRWPNPLVRYMDRCMFCDMDPPDHLGRDCPMKRANCP